MNLCPKCGKQIKELFYSAKVTTLAVLTVDGFYDEGGFEKNDERDAEEREYNCPECSALLFTEHEAPLDFLNTDELEVHSASCGLSDSFVKP